MQERILAPIGPDLDHIPANIADFRSYVKKCGFYSF